MKFKDGYWQMRPGVRGSYATAAHDVTVGAQAIRVLAPAKPIGRRGDTLDGPVLRVDLSAPMPGVVRVRATHFAGSVPAGPSFALTTEGTPISTDPAGDGPLAQVDDEHVSLTSGELTVRVGRGAPWGLTFSADGREVTRSDHKSLGAMTDADGGHHMVEQLHLGVGELVYGLGERFGPLVRNGQAVEIWNADGGTNSEQAYKNVPFYLSNRGYGVFVNHPGRVSFEVASETVTRVQFSVSGHELEYLVIHGPTPAEILRRYTALTGRPALPPAWSFGLWLSTSFTTDYDEATVTSFVDGMAERDIPLSVFHFDCFWMRQFRWCDFEWDPETFPDPPGMLARLHERDLKVCVWINPYIGQASALFDEGAARGYLLRRPDGRIWQDDHWQAGRALVDLTNPEARDWYAGKLRDLLRMGVDSFKTDFGERIPTDVVWADGSDPERMHNYYSLLYNELVFDLLEEERGTGDAVLFARAATVGGQRLPVHWGGDCESSYEAMAESLRGGLSLGMGGFGFWSHDIGGFEGRPDPAVFKRWVAFGLLSSHSRLHGSRSYRVPWLFDEESVDVLRDFTRLKARLMPYLYAAAVTAHTEGMPVMRAMALEFPDDPACAYLDAQYLLGPDLLVAPVLSAEGEVTYYVPAGRWTRWQDSRTVEGPGWRTETHGFDSLPLLVRPGAVVPVGARDDRPDYPYADGVILRAYQLADGTHRVVTVPDTDGAPAAVFEITRDGDRIRVTRDSLVRAPWHLVLVGVTGHESVTGGTAQTVTDGTWVSAEPETDQLEIVLRTEE
ncbi:alpha-xylosidase [Micromonospora endophytica]|uniref:alpha-D-xyloside xylohydrolase n=1 Tax=Micromonospora endophytica TaxID=515350 RepID=A0A2W2DK02_9ACTN|nr:alpha-xylosidase [Micromonospora endophytica]PZG01140.1 alpha-xylosidase [Micromonospora endophytica]RIW40729.1 alpha-xylosidase [Micromonospora endophytica]BCJ61801.1 alpha-xylosidase [Micromonospora endophytica]